jgi:hypothetical protein
MQRILEASSGATRLPRAPARLCPDDPEFRRRQPVAPGRNLILTRLLFPEAFGLMALVQVFVVGLQMFSDIGIQDLGDPQQPRRATPRFSTPPGRCRCCAARLLWLACLAIWPRLRRPSTRRRCCAASAGGGAQRVLILGFASINMASR